MLLKTYGIIRTIILENLEKSKNSFLEILVDTLKLEHDRPELKVKKLGHLELKNADYHKLFYQIALRDPLQPEHSVPVEVEVISSHELTPHKYRGKRDNLGR